MTVGLRKPQNRFEWLSSEDDPSIGALGAWVLPQGSDAIGCGCDYAQAHKTARIR
jgi:hypothetical protein